MDAQAGARYAVAKRAAAASLSGWDASGIPAR